MDKYINWIIGFDYYDVRHYALCVAKAVDGKLICYRVKEKDTTKCSAEMAVENEQGKNLGYVVDSRCKFSIPVGCVRKEIIRCEEVLVERVNQYYWSMEPLDEVIKKYNTLKSRYYHASADVLKPTYNEINELVDEIKARKAEFLQKKSTKKKKLGKYGNLKQLPNKNGISRVYSGGSCSGK